METIRKIIRGQSLNRLYQVMASTHKVYAPVVNTDNKVVYVYNPDYKDVTMEHIRSVLSVKNIVFPRVEQLFRYSNSKTESTITDINLENVPEIVLWATHPCDNAAFNALRSIFCWDTDDTFFSKRLEKVVIIGLSCHRSDEYCFCTSTGLTPEATGGSDILLSKMQNGDYLAQIITEKGNAIVSSCPELFEPSSEEKPLFTEVKQKFNHQQVTTVLAKNFEHPFWVENSLRCIGCGACAYVCPTCACFDIQDETRGKEGQRYRCWDSCGFGLFTLHTSGHNPRHVQSQRWRQRIMHKFSYMPDRNASLGCVGCGRCSSACPVDMNIAEQLEMIQNL